MNFLVVMPKSLGKVPNFDIFPLGLAYVSAALKSAGFSVTTANLEYVEKPTREALEELIRTYDIDVVCTGGLSRDYRKIASVLDASKAIRQDIVTIVGGGIISADPEPAMLALGADIGVIGEGEATIVELASALRSGTGLEVVKGITYRSGTDLVRTPPRKEIENIDEIPFPDFDGFHYRDWLAKSGRGVILTDRSCPFRCTFCFHPTGGKYRQRSLDNIFSEIEFQIAHFGIKAIGFTSELFSISKSRVSQFSQRIAPYGIAWGCCLRVPDIDADLLRVMKHSGCGNIVMGLESADDTILKSMRKGIRVKHIERALRLAYEANLQIESGFIFGDICDTEETIKRTLDFWHDNNSQHYLNLTMIQVFPGSQLYKHACDRGIIADRVKFLKDGCPVINVSRLTAPQFEHLKSTIAELRLHPHIPAHHLRMVALSSSGACSVEFGCRKCAERTVSDGLYFWHRKVDYCRACGIPNEIEPFRCADIQEGEFFAALPMEETIAIWCSTANGAARGVFYKLAKVFPRLTSNRFALIDTDPELHGLHLLGMEVHDPEVFRKLQVRCAVITDMTDAAAAHETLLTACPSITNVLVPSFRVQGDDVVPFLAHYPS